MKARVLSRQGATHRVLVLETGDEAMRELCAFIKAENIRAARFTAIGAFSRATLAYFDWEKKDYLEIPVEEQVEVLVLAGDVAWKGDEPVVHAHAVLGRRDGSTVGGHLMTASVRPTLEVMWTEAGALERQHDDGSGLALIAPEEPGQ